MSTSSCKVCGWMGEGHQLEHHQRTHRTTREAIALARAAPPPIATLATLKKPRRRRDL